MRMNRSYALGAAALALMLLLGACGSGGGGDSSGSGGGGSGPVASQLILGGPPECPTASYCLPGLKKTYGVTFEKFVPLDVGGPQTVAALKSGKIDVGELFSTDPQISVNDFVALEDDKHLQAAGNIVPAIRKDADSAQIDKLLNAVSAKVTTDNITPLIAKVAIDHEDPMTVAKQFLDQQGLMGSGSSGSGALTVGVSGNFAESQLMAAMYALVLEDAGYTTDTQLTLASRDVSDAALFKGDIDLKPEYVAYELGVLDKNADASGPAATVLPKLRDAYAKKGVNVLDFTPANDTNAFVVSQQTADQYGLSKVSDLAQSS